MCEYPQTRGEFSHLSHYIKGEHWHGKKALSHLLWFASHHPLPLSIKWSLFESLASPVSHTWSGGIVFLELRLPLLGTKKVFAYKYMAVFVSERWNLWLYLFPPTGSPLDRNGQNFSVSSFTTKIKNTLLIYNPCFQLDDRWNTIQR